MTTLSAHDVARELRKRLPQAGVLKLQKLLYYCQGWSLAWRGEPLFLERVEAWDQGPVVADIWHDEHRGRQVPPAKELSGGQSAVVDYVVARYGRFSGATLKHMTHREDPWKQFTGPDGELILENAEIDAAALMAWFTRDPAYVDHVDEADRLRRRRDVYSLDEPGITPALRAAAEQVLGRPVLDGSA